MLIQTDFFPHGTESTPQRNEFEVGKSLALILTSILHVALLLGTNISPGWAQPAGASSVSAKSEVTDAQRAALAEAERLETVAAQHTKDGKHNSALPLRIRALAALESAFGIDHPEIVRSIHLLADTYQHLGQMEQNLPLEIRALTIREKNLGPEHLDTAFSLASLAGSYVAMWQNDKALPLQIRALEIREKTLGADHPATALSLNNLAITYSNLNQHDNALPLELRALAIRETALGPEHPDTATSLQNLAKTYSRMGRYNEALPLQLRALAIREKEFGPEHFNTYLSLSPLAYTYDALAEHDKALSLRIRGLTIIEKSLGPEHSDKAAYFSSLASISEDIGNFREALPLRIRVLVLREQQSGSDHPDTAVSIDNLARTYYRLAQHGEARALYLRALSIREKVFGLNHPDVATLLNNLALTYSALDQYDQALPLQTRALEIYEKVLGVDHRESGSTRSNLANTYSALGQYEKALTLQTRALEIIKTQKDSNPFDLTTVRGNLAWIYSRLGQYDIALSLYLQSLAIAEELRGEWHPSLAISLHNVASAHVSLMQYEKALPFQLRALKIFQHALGPEHPETASSLNGVAGIYLRLDQPEKALPFALEALAIREKLLGQAHSDTANSLAFLSAIYFRLGDYSKVRPFASRALAIREKVLGPVHPDTASSLADLGWVNRRSGQPDLGVMFYKASVNAYQAMRQRVSSIGSYELRSYTASVERTYQALAALLTDQGRLAEAQIVLDMLKEDEQFDFIRRSQSADPRRSRIGYNATEQTWVTRYRQIADRLGALGAEERELEKQAKLGLTPEQKRRQQALAADLDVARKAFESTLTDMREAFASRGPARAVEVVETSVQAQRELQSLLKSLGDDVALVQYFITEDRVGMLVTTPGIQLARNTRVDAKELNRQIGAYRRLLGDPKSNPLPAAQALYQLLVAPIEKDLEQAGARTVMLSLDGALRYLPFGALHDGKQYLAQRWKMPMYTSVTREKLRDAATPTWQAAGLGVTQAWPEFKPLTGVREEIGGIVKTATGGVIPGEIYLDAAFTAARFKDVSQRQFPLLHVASHFRFSPGTEVNSFLLLGDGQQLTLGDIRTQNYRFDNVDLLTLSACDTGLGGGRDERGREIEGFGVIAQQQGAKAVLATLWPVADQSTAILMADMYRRRQTQNLTKIEALRQAQIALQSQPKYAHPYYWAPFILMGNWK